MDGVRCMESPAAGDAPHSSFRTLGPTLLVSMGYLDFGKWLVAVEAGSRFGYDLVLLVLLFNLSAILCQYLSSCIGIVTKKNLAEICHQEYDQKICVVLGLQAGLSLLTSEFTMIAGIVVGFNLVFESNNPITVVCFTSVVVNLLPYTLSLLDKRKAGMFNAYASGFTLVCFVLGLLVSHPKTPVNTNVMFPKLSGESAYSLMVLLGTNIIVHNFYTHSSVVQVNF
ncbi:Ethylene-insensitive protein 2 [Zea mays]|uniref:Ethylene-insensitive protein 2 n=2 Tax=Zea mays TaxID=4577 RepID=A0A1D6L0W0_MAIZE|nr:Ethylene-insensitive protein 2 [Zea mays]ONM08119.1 Ethylene-insensitive protein 2 [Zea mays]ONM08120.1 Ethylene-insensitive protein 2 [Zea mays]ONM08125.1 Ethylene-insensitive protein 2 [Zea mays]ONM08130.1 Ethylene-insensitive protein 2 [Zea mays]